jgi:hypothetical protein
MRAGPPDVRNPDMTADVIDLPQRESQARAAEIREALGAVREREAELVNIEADRTLEVGAQDADVADRVPLGEGHSSPQ